MFMQEVLDFGKVASIIRADECDGCTFILGTRGTPDTVDIVLCVAWHIVVDDQRYIVHINASRDDIGGNEDVNLGIAEIQHHLIAFFLLKVRVHGACIETLLPQGECEIFDALFLAYKDDDFLHTIVDKPLHHAGFLVVVEVHRHLMDRFGRARDGNLHFHGVVHDGFRHFTDISWHGG